jgi:hypothetical protein
MPLNQWAISWHRYCHSPLRLGWCRIQAQHFDTLPVVDVLQQDFAAVGKAHGIAISKGFGALLNEDHFLDFTNAQLLLQRPRDVP